LPRH